MKVLLKYAEMNGGKIKTLYDLNRYAKEDELLMVRGCGIKIITSINETLHSYGLPPIS